MTLDQAHYILSFVHTKDDPQVGFTRHNWRNTLSVQWY